MAVIAAKYILHNIFVFFLNSNSILYSIQELLVNFKPDVQFLFFSIFLYPFYRYLPLPRILCFPRGTRTSVPSIVSKLREEFLIYLDDATRFFPHRERDVEI